MEFRVSETVLDRADQNYRVREDQVNAIALRLQAREGVNGRREERKLLAKFSLRDQRNRREVH